MCESYRFAVGVENHAPENRGRGGKKKKTAVPRVRRGFASARRRSTAPGAETRDRAVPARIDRENWSALVGAHVGGRVRGHVAGAPADG